MAQYRPGTDHAGGGLRNDREAHVQTTCYQQFASLGPCDKGFNQSCGHCSEIANGNHIFEDSVWGDKIQDRVRRNGRRSGDEDLGGLFWEL